MYLLNKTITWWDNATAIAAAGRMGMPSWYALVPYPMSDCLFHCCSKAPSAVPWWPTGRVRTSAEGWVLLPGRPAAGTQEQLRNQTALQGCRQGNAPRPTAGTHLKLNEARLSLTQGSKLCNYMVRSLRKLLFCGCFKWRHISERYYRQLQTPDTSSSTTEGQALPRCLNRNLQVYSDWSYQKASRLSWQELNASLSLTFFKTSKIWLLRNCKPEL